jgi:sec-independent protein translocase protein TatB
MHTFLFVFEFLGTTELLVIAVVALILFGPRKLPEIGRTIGKAIGEFKRASDDFKRTWEYEVELEQRTPALDTGAASAAADLPEGDATSLPLEAAGADEFGGGEPRPDEWGTTVARGAADEDPDAARADARSKRADAETNELNAS